MPAAPAKAQAKKPGTMFVRIKPSNPKESHTAHGVTIRKAGGWHEVPTHVAKLLEQERMNPLNPDASPGVFDVQSRAEAEETVAQETVVADPAGTLDRPRVVTPTGPNAPKPPPEPGKGGKAAGKGKGGKAADADDEEDEP
jgi:hypothetical protein